MWQRHGITITVCLACTATLLGHVWLARHHERRIASLIASSNEFAPWWNPGDISRPDEVLFSGWDDAPATESRPRLLSAATYQTESDGSEEPADALQPAAEECISALRAKAAPPLTRRQLDDQTAVRGVIEAEMPETSAEERDIWFDELKSLPAEAVRDLLKVRQQLRVLSPDHQLSGPSPLLPMNAPPLVFDGQAIPTTTVTQSRPSELTDWLESRQALEQAMAWSTHNLANAATPGYKRIEVLLGDAYAAVRDRDQRNFMPAGGRGCCIKALRVDASEGALDERGRELDVAIEGEGWFIVRDADSGEIHYTRCGNWTVNAEGNLGLSAGDRWYIVEPSITVPQSALAIHIDVDGVVTIQAGSQDDFKELGQLALARFANPSQLVPVGHAVYAPLPGVSPTRAVPNAPRFGALRQGFLEQSNVDPDREQADREAWEAILRTLPVGDLPRTARDKSPSRN